MKIKMGDTVKIISGSSKGKEGKILHILRKENRVVVEKINIVKKHVKPSNTNETGGILEIEAPIHISNVKVIDKKEKKENKETKAKVAKKSTKKDESKK